MKRIVWYPFLCGENDEPGPMLYEGPMFWADPTLDEAGIVKDIKASLGAEEFLTPLRRLLDTNRAIRKVRDARQSR